MRRSEHLAARLYESKTFYSLDSQMYTCVGIYQRIRTKLHEALADCDRIMRIAFMSAGTATPRVSGFPKIHEVFEDRPEPWIGYPLTRTPVPHRPTLYLQERCKLAVHFQEMHDLVLLSDERSQSSIETFVREVDRLSAKMQRWYSHLPFELHYQWPMSVAVWELQSVERLPCNMFSVC